MKKQYVGLNRCLYSFSFNEKDKYDAYKRKYIGFYKEIFTQNGYCLEVKKVIL